MLSSGNIHSSVKGALGAGLPGRNVTGFYSIGRLCSELMARRGKSAQWSQVDEVSADITAPIWLDAEGSDVELKVCWADIGDGAVAFELLVPGPDGKPAPALRNGVIRMRTAGDRQARL